MNRALIIPLSDPVFVEDMYFTSIEGLSFIQRLCWLSKKAGYADSVVIYPDHPVDIKKILNRAPGQIFQTLEKASPRPDSTFVFLRKDIFPTVDFLKKIPEPQKTDTLYLMEESSPVMVIKVSDVAKLSEILRNRSNRVSLQDTLNKGYPAFVFNLYNVDYHNVTNHDDVSHVEKRLYLGLIKVTDSFISRHVHRKISQAITRRLITTSITPNQMSLISIGVGLGGGYFLSFPNNSLQAFGSVLFLLHSILDGCDGELARLKYMESRWGGLLDYWGDNIVHSAVFFGIGLAWKEATGLRIALWCSGFAIAGGLLSAGLVYSMTMKSKKNEGPLYTSVSSKAIKSRAEKIADYLSRRDFIYLVLILAIFGKVHWFLILAALGAPLFFLFVLRSNLK